jgi:hypothetical protein
MANAATSRATRPFATMWDADELVLAGLALVPVPVLVPFPVPFPVPVPVPVAAGAAVDGKGVPVATAPTPPVTGPLSEICESLQEHDERLGSLWKEGSNARVLRSHQGP